MKTEGQGLDFMLIITDQQIPADLSVRGYLKEQKGDSYLATAPR